MHSGGKKMELRNCFPGLPPPNNKGRREYTSRPPKAGGARRGVLPIWLPTKGQFTGGRTPTLAQKRRFVADLPGAVTRLSSPACTLHCGTESTGD